MSHCLEYIWADKQGHLRSKMKVLDKYVSSLELEDVPLWNFDGSSTGQDIGQNTEVVLKPVRVYNDPFESSVFGIQSRLVLCELDLDYDQRSHLFYDGEEDDGEEDDGEEDDGEEDDGEEDDGEEDDGEEDDGEEPESEPVGIVGFNTRYWASHIAQEYADQKAWFGLEQEYVLTEKYHESTLDEDFERPLQWEKLSREGQGNYYCSVRYPHAQCNMIARKHLHLCLKAGVKIAGFNAEVLPNQWEFQVGPSDLLRVGDDILMGRYILTRLAAEHGLGVSFHPKIVPGEWNGSGCHINYSTEAMRETGGNGMKVIRQAIDNLEKDHPNILQFYGQKNHLRLTGKHETSSAEVFSWGVGTRDTSVRVPTLVEKAGGGYLEDRRPGSNIDPYFAMAALLDVSCSGKSLTMGSINPK